mgnify:CR=1 FL=1
MARVVVGFVAQHRPQRGEERAQRYRDEDGGGEPHQDAAYGDGDHRVGRQATIADGVATERLCAVRAEGVCGRRGGRQREFGVLFERVERQSADQISACELACLGGRQRQDACGRLERKGQDAGGTAESERDGAEGLFRAGTGCREADRLSGAGYGLGKTAGEVKSEE